MSAIAWPLGFTLFAWWFSTGAILYLDGLPRRTFRWTFAGASALCVLGLWGLAISSAQTTPASAYCAFTCALLVWAWQEIAFLFGFVTGPRRIDCDPNAKGWRRASLAFQTIVHHEIALVVLAIAVFAVTWDQPNRTGLWTFLVLWVMRQSAKLNVFLGVRNLNENFLPEHLRYLQTYFMRKAMNPLLPVSVGVATIVVVPLWQSILAADVSSFDATSRALVASLLSLAILEHLLLVLPLPSDILWRWGMQSHSRKAPVPPL